MHHLRGHLSPEQCDALDPSAKRLLTDPLFGPEALNVFCIFFAKEVFQHLHTLVACRHGCHFTNGMANIAEDIGGMLRKRTSGRGSGDLLKE